MENGSKRRSEGEIGVLDKIGEVISELNKSKHADQAICALHSIAFLLFPLYPSLFSGAIGERCREKVKLLQLMRGEKQVVEGFLPRSCIQIICSGFVDWLPVLCLLENYGVLQMAREFGGSFQSEDYTIESPTSLSSQHPLISSADN